MKTGAAEPHGQVARKCNGKDAVMSMFVTADKSFIRKQDENKVRQRVDYFCDVDGSVIVLDTVRHIFSGHIVSAYLFTPVECTCHRLPESSLVWSWVLNRRQP